VKVTRRAPLPEPGARERALARLNARAADHDNTDEDLEERDEEVRGGWIPESIRPERLRDARWTLAPRHVLVLAVILSIGLAWAAWSVFRTRPEVLPDTRPPTALTTGSPVTQPSTGAASTSAQTSPGTPGQSAAGTVVVHVAGKVRRPGLVRAPTGSRVADVLALAGGPLPGVDLTTLNLARQVTDGEQILVGLPDTSTSAPGSTASTGATAPTDSPVNLNTATLDELDALPGVGPVLAQRILDYRSENGPFTTIDQLQEVPGVGPKKFESLKPHVRI
jgi:competence protein ComEA